MQGFRPSGGFGRRLSLVPVLAALLIPSTRPALADHADAAPDPAESEPEAPTFLDSVTVTASRSPRAVKDTAGSVSVIDAQEIAELGMTDLQDLVKWQPGIYVENEASRLGLGGFNVRGIGENRVLTRIDGVPAAERFDFGPLAATQYAIDLDLLETVEIVRSAGSSLYGSDALGGVVSLATRDPASYLADGSPFAELKAGYDGRDSEVSETLTFAAGGPRWQGSLVASRRDGEEIDNRGTVDVAGDLRTRPNPQDRASTGVLGKLSRTGDGGAFKAAVEWFDAETETRVLNGQGPAVEDFDARDAQDRVRLSLEHLVTAASGAFDTVFWRAFAQRSATEQRTDEQRVGTAGPFRRDGLLTFDQDTLGGELQLQKRLVSGGAEHLLTYGLSVTEDAFDQLRDRVDVSLATGEELPSFLFYPTKYFPASTVREVGLYVQDEIELAGGRLRLIPGLRWDGYDLDADQDDEVYLAGNEGIEPPVDVSVNAVSPRIGVVAAVTSEVSLFAQYARGFRAPPYSAVNNGFTNFAGGYTTLPNPDLEPETSDNLEVGVRGAFAHGSFSVTLFDNRYDDFIETVVLPFDPRTGLLEFQARNVDDASISGVELAGDWRFGRAWTARASFAYVDGDNDVTGEPLLSIAPPRLVLGLRYQSPDRVWGGDLTATFGAGKDESDLPAESAQFAAPSYQVVDLTGYRQFAGGLSLQAGIYNLFDETYWPWSNARGLSAGAENLDFFTRPGRSFGTILRYRF